MKPRRQALMPKPPQWALDAGLPAPEKNENYCEYVTRLGYNCSELLADLTPRTHQIAHERLVSKLIVSLPEVWDRHLRVFVRAHARPGKVAKPVPFRR